ALCCAGQRLLHHTRFAHYERSGRLATGGRRGFHLTEGAVAFAVRRLRDAERDGQPILAIVRELRGASSPAGPWPALREAIKLTHANHAATFMPKRIECVASGVEKDEADERTILNETYQEEADQRVSATPQLGMAQGASGLVGLLHLVASVPAQGSERVPAAL